MARSPKSTGGWLSRSRGYLLLSMLWLAVLGAVVYLLRRPEDAPFAVVPPPATFTPAPGPTSAPLRVDVAGAVVQPDVYVLPLGSIVRDAIRAAGGASPDADIAQVNQAMPLRDGMQVYVPRRGEMARVVPATSAASAPATPGGKVNINTASLEELDTLPGVGPATAQKIVAGRPYVTVEDILRVPGIGPATFEKLKGLIVTQ
ncbi:MAG: ComEA family DNA-binding protein [Anaerolineae bacterium]|nr:ComEA family DNA-binding protein [Anaerolineae bacterium]